MAPLQRTIALAQVDRVLVCIGEDLDFDVPRPLQVFLQIDHWIGESRLRLAARHVDGIEQRRLGVDDPHAAPTAAAGGLDDHGIADLACDAHDLLAVLG